MNATKRPSDETLNRILDREVYQIFWLNQVGDTCIDGGGKVTDLDRESALEAYREGNVFKVVCINPVELTIRDVTDEIAGEIEFEQEQAIIAGDTYVPRLSLYANSAGRSL